MGFDVWIASNDRNHPYADGRLVHGALTGLPQAVTASRPADAIGLVDVLWPTRTHGSAAAASRGALLGSCDVRQDRHHPELGVVGVVAVQGPLTRIVGLQVDGERAHR